MMDSVMMIFSKLFTTCVLTHGHCHVWPWLIEFSGVVLSFFTLSGLPIFTEVSPMKPEDLPHTNTIVQGYGPGKVWILHWWFRKYHFLPPNSTSSMILTVLLPPSFSLMDLLSCYDSHQQKRWRQCSPPPFFFFFLILWNLWWKVTLMRDQPFV